MEGGQCDNPRIDEKGEVEDYEEFLEANLFVNEDYQIRKYTFGDESIELYCLQSSYTDFDLTGQLVWPGAELLAGYLLKNKALLRGSSILELGAGVGLAGLVCAKYCDSLFLTDHNEIVLKVLQTSVDHQIPFWNPPSPTVVVRKLEWGSDEDIDSILEKHRNGFDMIIGADLCYQEKFVPLLFRTIRALLMHKMGASSALLSYVSRIKRMDGVIVAEALKQHLEMKEIPETRRSLCGDLCEGWIYKISVPETALTS